MDLIVIDCEASGLGKESYPIEIGVAHKKNSFSFLIKPHTEWTYWDKNAENIHNIKQEELADGLTLYESVIKLNAQLKNCDVYSNATDYDEIWINLLFSKVGVKKMFNIKSIYELKFDRSIYNYEKDKLSHKAKSSIISLNKLHRAETDAVIIRNSILKAMKYQ